MILELVIWPNDVLTKITDSVTEFDYSLKQLCENMAETMYYNNGIGLAAPQVGINKRILVIDVPDSMGNSRLHYIINPKILDKSGNINISEGCLSLPGITVNVDRSKMVTIEYYDFNGNNNILACSDLEAICLQHEIDHLDGIVMLDKISTVVRNIMIKKLKNK
jgi:peptide deformylase